MGSAQPEQSEAEQKLISELKEIDLLLKEAEALKREGKINASNAVISRCRIRVAIVQTKIPNEPKLWMLAFSFDMHLKSLFREELTF